MIGAVDVGERFRRAVSSKHGQALVRQELYRKDFRTFAAEQLFVSTKPPNPRITRLDHFWPSQEIFLKAMEAQERETGFIRMAILKARQHGGTRLALARCFWKSSLNPYTNSFIAANDRATAENIHRANRLFYERMDAAIRPKIRLHNKNELLFEDKDNPEHGLHSSILVDTAKNIHVGVSRTLTCLHLSEVARYGQAVDAISAVTGAIPMSPGTMIVQESTAHVMGWYFKEQCERAQRGEGGWRFAFAPWFINPDYRIPLSKGEKLRLMAKERLLVKQFGLSPSQVKWRRWKIAELGGNEQLFEQDFPSTPEEAWISIGMTVFRPPLLRKLSAHLMPPKRRCDIFPKENRILDVEEGDFWIWEDPMLGGEYDIGVDVALGDDERREGVWTDDGSEEEARKVISYSAIQVLRRGSFLQVAEWKGTVDPLYLAEMAACVGYYYNTAQVAPENQGVGIATTGYLSRKLHYPYVHRWRHRDQVSQKMTKHVGWDTGTRSKEYLIAFAVNLVRERAESDPLIRSQRLFDELRFYVQTGYRSYGPSAGHKDDLVSGWLIALTTSDDEKFDDIVSGEDRKTERLEEQFFEPGKGPRNTLVDPAYTDADMEERVSLLQATEVDGW